MSKGGWKALTFLGHGLILLLVFSGTVNAQLGSLEFLQLKHQLQAGGATYEIGANQATDRSLRELCGLMAPTRWTPEMAYRLRSHAQDPIGGASGTVALPSAFNWCSQGACPPIRDQGSCGSCWAFATVGPLESNILLYEGKSVDLSEQYLVSCNVNRWSCGGGWWAHDYHEWKYNASETEAGAVLEADFAYTARDTACGSPYDHPYKITDWAYVSSPFGIPPTEDIKRAIMTYGPVTAAVYVGSAFQYYRSGVFNTNIDAAVNHGIVLVGWDDNQGANGVWILRNSWGTGWGENGYMKIEYGASRVGYGASYVVYDPPPVQADFSADPTTGTDSLTVQFADHSTGNPTAWFWTFGDGQTSTLKNPSHTYASPGTYSVSLEASRPDSTDIIVKTDYITVAESTPPPPLVPPDAIELPAAGSYGYKAPGVLTNQSSVDFWFGGRTGDVVIECEFYDADYGDEIEILINGQPVGYAPRTGNNSWSGIKYITLPDSYVSDSAANVLTVRNAYSQTFIWGVRDIQESEV
ncbi:C1 family peptidase, partial [Desulfatiglans anilini]|uniref:C1 family peptidase n=1 Tax=Desulfatiglans anilini TaxID=90728 RepID=UPI0006866D10